MDEELGTPDFAERGWHRLCDLADYISSLVDGRSVGRYERGERRTEERVVGLGSVLKASAQWLAFDHATARPKFVVEAERYLAAGTHGRPLFVPFVPEKLQSVNLRSGLVLPRKRGLGARRRLHSLAALVAEIVTLLERVPAEQLREHMEAYWDGSYRLPVGQRRVPWVLPVAIAESIIFAIPRGTFSDLLRAQNFRWNPDEQFPKVFAAVADIIDDSDLSGASGVTRRARLEGIACKCIEEGLKAFGIGRPKDFFRNRRASSRRGHGRGPHGPRPVRARPPRTG